AITLCFCIHDTATSALSPLSLHDALPISRRNSGFRRFTVHPPEGLIRGESRSLRSRHPGAWWTLVTNLVNAPHSCNDRLPGAAAQPPSSASSARKASSSSTRTPSSLALVSLEPAPGPS